MKKLKFLIISVLFSILFGPLGYGQELYHQGYDWDAVPVVPKDTCIDTSDQAIYLIDKVVLQYYFNDKDEFSMVETVHRKILIRDKQAIDDFNKVYINVDTSTDIVSLKARAVSASGDVVMFDKENIKEIKDDENGDSKIFAIDGLAEGGMMELLYTINKSPNIWGRRFFQSGYPRLNAEFRLLCPEFLEFATHSVNNFPDAPGRLMDEERSYIALAKGIPGLPEEEYANYNTNLQMIEYTLAVNHNKSSARIYDFKQASQHYWELYNDIQDGELKEIKNILKGAGVKKNMSQEEMIRAVDIYIKTQFLIVESISGISKKDITPLIQIKVLDKEACMKLFVGIMRELGVDYQIILTTNRFQKTLCRDFESWGNLDESLLYFPGSQAYICPYSSYSRYNLLPFALIGNDGLFIKKIEYQGLESGVGKIQPIPVLPSEQSIDSLIVSAILPPDFNDAIYDISYKMTGYRALFFLQAYSSTEDNKKEENALPYVKIISEDCDVDELKVTNADEPATFFLQPVVISAKVKTNAPVEKAGEKYLFNIGKLIGEQSHLYDEEKRLLPIEIEYQHKFYRLLTINIPEGFIVKNPEILNMETSYSRDGKTCTFFKSTYQMNGKQIKVEIMESYDIIRAPVEDYKPFSEVINAAADFNKLTLIIEKKGQ